MNKYNPLVSIIIPVYNGGDFLKEAIDSAINQTYKNIEIIVVNDGSSDNGETERIALSYGDKVRYYKKENGGCASALNFGISKMHGEWFSWLSHDDAYYPDKIQKAIDVVNEKNIINSKAVVLCSSSIIDADSNIISVRKYNNDIEWVSSRNMFNRFMSGKALNGCALLIPKVALDQAGEFSETYVYILDWIYWIKLTLLDYGFYCTSDVLVKNRKHNNQVSVKKRYALKTETEKYILELIDTVANDKERLKAIWLYCKQINFEKGCRKVEDLVHITIKMRLCGIIRSLYHVLYAFARKVLR